MRPRSWDSSPRMSMGNAPARDTGWIARATIGHKTGKWQTPRPPETPMPVRRLAAGSLVLLVLLTAEVGGGESLPAPQALRDVLAAVRARRDVPALGAV